jgi:hypothetical protein
LAEHDDQTVVASELKARMTPRDAHVAKHELALCSDQRPSILGGPKQQMPRPDTAGVWFEAQLDRKGGWLVLVFIAG